MKHVFTTLASVIVLVSITACSAEDMSPSQESGSSIAEDAAETKVLDPTQTAIESILTKYCSPQSAITSELVYGSPTGGKYVVKMNSQAGELTMFLSEPFGSSPERWNMEILTSVESWGCTGRFYELNSN